MPELSRFEGMVIKMLFNDTVQHNKPHVHVTYGEYKASVGIDELPLIFTSEMIGFAITLTTNASPSWKALTSSNCPLTNNERTILATSLSVTR